MLTGVLFLLVGAAVSALQYGGIFIVALAVCGLHGITHTRWAHVAGCAWFMSASIAAVRTPAEYWTSWRWNVKGPSNIPDVDGWNLIPYGSDTLRSVVKIVSALLVTGPQFIVSGIQEFRTIWKGNKGDNPASHGTALPRRP